MEMERRSFLKLSGAFLASIGCSLVEKPRVAGLLRAPDKGTLTYGPARSRVWIATSDPVLLTSGHPRTILQIEPIEMCAMFDMSFCACPTYGNMDAAVTFCVCHQKRRAGNGDEYEPASVMPLDVDGVPGVFAWQDGPAEISTPFMVTAVNERAVMRQIMPIDGRIVVLPGQFLCIVAAFSGEGSVLAQASMTGECVGLFE